MSIGPMSGVQGSAAGAPLSQTKGSETERAAKDSSATQRQVKNDTKAEQAAGIGQTEGDEGPADRDADGRKLWEDSTDFSSQEETPEESSAGEEDPSPQQTEDPTGETGNALDLTG